MLGETLCIGNSVHEGWEMEGRGSLHPEGKRLALVIHQVARRGVKYVRLLCARAAL